MPQLVLLCSFIKRKLCKFQIHRNQYQLLTWVYSREASADEKQGALSNVHCSFVHDTKYSNWRETPEWEELREVERGGIHDQNILNANLLNKNK